MEALGKILAAFASLARRLVVPLDEVLACFAPHRVRAGHQEQLLRVPLRPGLILHFYPGRFFEMKKELPAVRKVETWNYLRTRRCVSQRCSFSSRVRPRPDEQGG